MGICIVFPAIITELFLGKNDADGRYSPTAERDTWESKKNNLTTKITRKSRSLALSFSKKNSLNDDIQLDFEIELMHGNGNDLWLPSKLEN